MPHERPDRDWYSVRIILARGDQRRLQMLARARGERIGAIVARAIRRILAEEWPAVEAEIVASASAAREGEEARP